MPDPSARRARAGRPSYAVALLTAACVVLAASESPSATPPSFSAVDAPGAIRTDFYGINNAGQIVGVYTDAAGSHHPFLRSAAGTISGFSVTGADPSRTEAAGINDSGQIVGTFLDAGGTAHCYVASAAGAVSTIDLTAKGLPANDAACYGINNTGSIVGELAARAFIRSPAGAVTFVNLKRAAAAGINNAGQVVGGYAINDSSDNTRGFLWAPGGTVTTFDVPGAVSTNPNTINNKGEIAGSFRDTGGRVRGFIRSVAGTAAAYNAPGAVETQVTGLNDAKRIVGIFKDATGKWHGFVAAR
ncbi:MAG TPA: hypothetical protein VJT33_04105 [bacterium]|nr:hypothetical protein [bacterium]